MSIDICQLQRSSLLYIGVNNITRCEGDRYVIIPCYYGRDIYITNWKINGMDYIQDQVNEANPEFNAVLNNGIVINTVTSEMNNTTFQCFISIMGQGTISNPKETGTLEVKQCNGKQVHNYVHFIEHQLLF